MIRQTIKQLWNKRRSNGWIFLELILVVFFMWGVTDPVYVLLSNRAIHAGYEIDHTFKVMVGQYDNNHSKYKKENDTDSVRKAMFMRIDDMIRQYPGVEASVMVAGYQYPLSMGSRQWNLGYDTLKVNVQQMGFLHSGDFFKVFRIPEVHTNIIPDHRNHTNNPLYITRNIAQRLNIPEQQAVGKELYNAHDSTSFTVVGVMPNFKFQTTRQPTPTVFMPLQNIQFSGARSGEFCFRIRSDISPQIFMEKFKTELGPRMNLGNLYFLNITSFDTLFNQSEFRMGTTNKLRLQTALATFFLICTFLGIAGTFWLHSNARRGEIGLRMAMGSTRKQILKQFLTESWIITTAAWIIGIFFSLQRVYLTGFAEPPRFADPAYIQNLFVPHFLIVSIIIYVLIMIISFIGTWIPASRAARIEPAEALRDE